VIYGTGRGVPKDDVESARWYGKAAEQGYPKAQYALAGDFEAGRGVAQDIVEAHKWYHLAAVLGTDEVKAAAIKDGDRLGTKMTAEQMAEAVKRAKTWVDEFQKKAKQ
jgi:TPR repeat protein